MRRMIDRVCEVYVCAGDGEAAWRQRRQVARAYCAISTAFFVLPLAPALLRLKRYQTNEMCVTKSKEILISENELRQVVGDELRFCNFNALYVSKRNHIKM